MTDLYLGTVPIPVKARADAARFRLQKGLAERHQSGAFGPHQGAGDSLAWEYPFRCGTVKGHLRCIYSRHVFFAGRRRAISLEIHDEDVFAGDTVLIVDFKTNRPPPAREEDVPGIYATQMALYRAAAARIFPGKRIACALVWTEGPSLMALSEAFLEAETGRVRARLDRDRRGS